jgi:lipopolysaccharide/colanic/teichoic acid biosynthesis glycosyltransferase
LARAASIRASSDHRRSTTVPSRATDQAEFVASAWNRAFDVAVAASLLVMLSPMFAMLSLLIARDGGPVFSSHKRAGRGGRVFRYLKFRSTVANASDVLELQDDQRMTSIGGILRSTGLDELPQLLNVLRGDMSLLGPRPVMQDELQHSDGTSNAYYLMIWPGITGVWQ